MGNGWAKMDEDDERRGGGGGGGRVWNFFLSKEDGEKRRRKRVLFIEAEPFVTYEHPCFGLTGNQEDVYECLKRTSGEDCPLCDLTDQKNEAFLKKIGITPAQWKTAKIMAWSRFVGYFTVIDLGYAEYDGKGNCRLLPFVGEKGSYQFQRRVFRAQKGTTNRAGALMRIRDLISRKGGGTERGMKGVVLEIGRNGTQSEGVGDDFDFVERVDEADWLDYMIKYGADKIYDKPEEEIELEPVDFDRHIRQISPRKMMDMIEDMANRIKRKDRDDGGGRGNRDDDRGRGNDSWGGRGRDNGHDNGPPARRGNDRDGNDFSDDEIPF